MAKKLYVGNLPYEMKEDELRNVFSEFKTITDVKIITDRFTGSSRGFGFIEFDEDAEAKEAIRKFNGHKIGDKEIVVNEARPKKDRREFRRRRMRY